MAEAAGEHRFPAIAAKREALEIAVEQHDCAFSRLWHDDRRAIMAAGDAYAEAVLGAAFAVVSHRDAWRIRAELRRARECP